MRLLNEILLANQDASTSFNSPAGLLASVFGYSIQAIITGTAAGTMKLQGSSDPVPDSRFPAAWPTPVNWTDVKDSSEAVTGTGTIMYNVADVEYNWVRVVYTSSSGTGTISITLNTKGF